LFVIVACHTDVSPSHRGHARLYRCLIVELADKGGKTLVAYLVSRDTGDQTGTLKMSVNAGQTELCYSLRYTGSIAKPTAIVIYRGDTSVNATTVQAFTFTASGPLYACTTTSVSREFLHDIGRNAADFGVGVAVAASVVLRGRFESLKQPYH
jgi:hypothetical protein